MTLEALKKKIELKKNNEDLKKVKAILCLDESLKAIEKGLKIKFREIDKELRIEIKEIYNNLTDLKEGIEKNNNDLQENKQDNLYKNTDLENKIENINKSIKNILENKEVNEKDLNKFVKNTQAEMIKLNEAYSEIYNITEKQTQKHNKLLTKFNLIKKQRNFKGEKLLNVGYATENTDGANLQNVRDEIGKIRIPAYAGGGGGSSGGGTWGSITGTLSDQTDLQNALDLKTDISSLSTVATSGSYPDLLNKPTIPTSHTQLSEIGTNTHAQIDSHISSLLNPHSVTSSQVGLGNVENTALSTWIGSTNITTLGTITTGSVPYSLISGTPTIPKLDDGIAQGQMAFWDATAGKWTYTETSELFWDDTNKRVGIGTATPTTELHINKIVQNTTPLFKLTGIGNFTGSPTDAVEGVGIGLVFNGSGNRQFWIGDSASGSGLRIIGSATATSLTGWNYVTSTAQNVFFSANLGVGTSSPRRSLDILNASNPQLRLTHTDNSVYTDLQANSSGYLSILPSGKQVNINVGVDSSATTDFLINPTTKTSGRFLDFRVNSVTKAFIGYTGEAVFYGYLQTLSFFLGPNNWNISSVSGGNTASNQFNFNQYANIAKTNTSGLSRWMTLNPIYNQASGTASNTDLLINRTETAIGSGTQLLTDWQVGGVSKARLTNTGNFYEAGTFAEIHVHDNSTAQTIPTGATYTKITAFDSNGFSSNCTPDQANDKITITKTGIYRVEGAFSFSSGTNNVEVFGSAFLNGTEQDQIHWTRKVGTAGDVGNANFTGLIDVTTVPWDLDFRVRHGGAGNVDLTFSYANLNVFYLGET